MVGRWISYLRRPIFLCYVSFRECILLGVSYAFSNTPPQKKLTNVPKKGVPFQQERMVFQSHHFFSVTFLSFGVEFLLTSKDSYKEKVGIDKRRVGVEFHDQLEWPRWIWMKKSLAGLWTEHLFFWGGWKNFSMAVNKSNPDAHVGKMYLHLP